MLVHFERILYIARARISNTRIMYITGMAGLANQSPVYDESRSNKRIQETRRARRKRIPVISLPGDVTS